MNPIRQRRAFALLASLGLVVAASIGPPAIGQGQGQAPAAAKAIRPGDLLKSAPFDRIFLIDDSRFDIEPLTTRPLPPIDNKKRARSLVEIEENARKIEENRPRKGDPFSKKEPDDADQMVIIHLLEGEPRDFKVKRSSIKDVKYFEDMLLEETDRFIKEADYPRAFERILLVKNREPNWRGLDDRVNRLLFEEGSGALVEDNARGLRLLIDLSARKGDYPGLADRLGNSFGRRIEKAVEAGDFLVGRRLLRELEQLAPGHPESRAARARFTTRAKGLLDQAAKANPSDRVDRLAEAARIWPDSDGLESAYREAFRVEPTLSVAVTDLADPVGPFPASASSDRIARLVYLPTLINDDDEAIRGEVGGQLLAALESVELGKMLKITLRPGPTWSDGSRPASSIDVARSLADRALPASPGFNARWADLLERVEAVDETHVEVKLSRPSMRPAVWLLGPVGPAHASSDGWISSTSQGRRPVGDGLYRWESTGDAATLLHAAEPNASVGPMKIRRIREVRYPNPAASIEGLLRGDVAMLEHVPPERLADLRKESATIRIGHFSTPSVHRIALDGRTASLRNRNLRRALSLAIDRRGLLEEVVLRRPPDDVNLVSDGPFVKGSFVDSQGTEPFAYNPLLAKGLVNAARKDLGGNPIRLTFEYPPTAEARAVCPKIAEAFTLIGIEVQLAERPESELESGLRAGRRFDLAYRSSRPSHPLHDAGTLLVPGYDATTSADALGSAASPRILQLLVQLDRAPETTSARTLALQIDRESRDELPVLPLWQLEDHYAWRSTLKGPPETSEHFYQGIAAWEIEPWFAKDSF